MTPESTNVSLGQKNHTYTLITTPLPPYEHEILTQSVANAGSPIRAGQQ